MNQEIEFLPKKSSLKSRAFIIFFLSFIFPFSIPSFAQEPISDKVLTLIKEYVQSGNKKSTERFFQRFELSFYDAEAAHIPVDPTAPPIARAVQYLRNTQVTPMEEFLIGRDFAGNWPQYLYLASYPSIRIRDVSPFMPTFIHHALTLITDENINTLNLTPVEAVDARTMRQNAIDLMLRFKAREEDPDAGTFGYWPYQKISFNFLDWWLALLLQLVFEGPLFMGSRAPFNVSFFPPALAFSTDADDTATIYAALLDHSLLDEGPVIDVSIERFFSDWRDLGQVPRRLNPDWLPHASGAFLTWLAYRDPPDNSLPNDVDLVVNASILYTLARYDHLDTPGVQESISLINTATKQKLYATRPEEVSDYYPYNYSYHYYISRAYHEGPVPTLKPAVEILADELENTAQHNPNGTVFWDRGDPNLNTALAILTLLNAGRTGPHIDSAVDYLLAEQDPIYGNWKEGIFYVGRVDAGYVVNAVSPALTTAIVLEALCRHKLAEHR
jgi:hypothetical protein